MEFTTENLTDFFNKKLAEAEKIDAINDERGLERWWSGVKRCGTLMGKDYAELLGDIRFHAGAYLMGNPEFNDQADMDARERGLEEAKNNIGKVLDDLSLFGYLPEKGDQGKKKMTKTEKSINNLVTINNSQTSNITISISDFDSETQKNIKDLQAELQKKKKNKVAIKKILTKLGETGLDALEKIFLHSIGIN